MDQIGINGWQLIIQLISFIVFIGLLWKFAVGPITSMLDERQDKIRESMEAAERTQAEMKQTLSRNEEILQEARREAQDIVSNGRTTSEQLIAKAREEASAQSDEYLERARGTLRQETEQARLLLRDEVADLAVIAAGRIVRKELDPSAQSRLIADTLAQAGGSPTASQN